MACGRVKLHRPFWDRWWRFSPQCRAGSRGGSQLWPGKSRAGLTVARHSSPPEAFASRALRAGPAARLVSWSVLAIIEGRSLTSETPVAQPLMMRKYARISNRGHCEGARSLSCVNRVKADDGRDDAVAKLLPAPVERARNKTCLRDAAACNSGCSWPKKGGVDALSSDWPTPSTTPARRPPQPRRSQECGVRPYHNPASQVLACKS